MMANIKESMQPLDSDTTIMRQVKQVAECVWKFGSAVSQICRSLPVKLANNKTLPTVAVVKRYC